MTKEEAVLISAYTGFLLTQNFVDVQKFCGTLLGRPISTYELASKDLLEEIREKCRPMIIEMIKGEVDNTKPPINNMFAEHCETT